MVIILGFLVYKLNLLPIGCKKVNQTYIVGKVRYGIGFAYEEDGTKEAYEEYFNKTTDQLKRKFGNDLVGWDMAASSTLIKGF